MFAHTEGKNIFALFGNNLIPSRINAFPPVSHLPLVGTICTIGEHPSTVSSTHDNGVIKTTLYHLQMKILFGGGSAVIYSYNIVH